MQKKRVQKKPYRRTNKKKVYMKTIKIKNLYASIICLLTILIIINVLNQEGFLTYNLVPSYTDNPDSSEQMVAVEEDKAKDIASNITSVIGIHDITYEDEGDKQIPTPKVENKTNTIQTYDMTKLNDPEYLKNNFYIVDKRTQFIASDFSAEKFLSQDLSIDTASNQPKVLIFHTHSHEGFVGGDPNNINDGIYGVGELLAQTLTNDYGIITMHDDGRYDYVNGKPDISGAYERMEPAIEKVLADNPSIEVAIDLHRDGVDESVHLVKNIDGKPTAQIMFFNGLCKYLKDGKLVAGAKNPYLDDNLAFSFQMQLKSKELYPEFTRKIYLHAYRFSLHMKERSLLIELGAQTNTVEEARNAVTPLAKILSEVLQN